MINLKLLHSLFSMTNENQSIPQLDILLEQPIVLHPGTDAEFSAALSDMGWEGVGVRSLYAGTTFMLFEYKKQSYIRIASAEKTDRCHHIIVEAFEAEIKDSELDPTSILVKGGGHLELRREELQTIATFHGSSFEYGRFDSRLLTKLLEDKLKIKYGIR